MDARYFLIAMLLAMGLFLEGCKSRFVSLPSNYSQTDALFIQFLEKNLGTDWYGIYLQKIKIGYLKSTASCEKDSNRSIYKIQLSGTIQMQTQTEVDTMKILTNAEFSVRPPYLLLRYSDRMIRKNEISETNIVKLPQGFEASITQGRETRRRMIGSLDYTLKDYCELQRWIAQEPKAGDGIKYRHLNLATLEVEENTARIKAIHDAFVNGIKATYYEVLSAGPNGLEIQEVFGSDGKAYSIILGGQFECRLEPYELAVEMDTPIDLFIRNTVPVNKPLGNSEKVTLLKLSLKDATGTLLEDAPGQTVTHNLAKESLIVIVNPDGVPYVSATDEETYKNLAATSDIPANHPKIIDLALKAVGDAENTAEKVSRLVIFVYHYIEDDYTANPLSIMDTISKKKGDCSEHSELFTAMARSLGIPCRTVGGLVYLGDDVKAFGLHAWNEVIINGVWVPVDATLGQTLIDATHIRFPVDISKEWQVMARIPKIKLEVLHVAYRQ